MENKTGKHNCDNCSWRRYAERKPNTLLARLWKWHTGWCPGWKAYQKSLVERKPSSQPKNQRGFSTP